MSLSDLDHQVLMPNPFDIIKRLRRKDGNIPHDLSIKK